MSVELSPLELPPVSKEQLVRYAGASGDFNPIHWDADFAREAGYAGPIAHGMLSMAFLGRACVAWTGAAGVLRLTARFRSVTYPGDVLTVTGEVVDARDGEIDVKLTVSKQDGVVTTTGEATLRTPPG